MACGYGPGTPFTALKFFKNRLEGFVPRGGIFFLQSFRDY